MSNMFANIARKATTISPLIEGKNKIAVSDIIANYPDGITVIAFDVISGSDQNGNPTTYPVVVFAEDDSKFAFGGTVLKNIINAWITNFDGDVSACSAALSASGGVKMRFAQGRTKSGRNVTTIDIIG